jgi:hypothetical protein
MSVRTHRSAGARYGHAARCALALAALFAALAGCAPLAPGAAAAATGPAPHAAAGPLPVPANLVALTQPAGAARLLSATDKTAYWPLSQYFETQKNEAYCSVASSVMVLNALGIRRPATTQYPDFPFFTQDDFFRGVDPGIASAAQVAREGMTLDQLGDALQDFPVKVERYHADDLTLAQFRALIRSATGTPSRFALLNYHRKEIGEVGGGHWSPLAAYDAATDSVLVLDVARYKYPAVWVPLAQLFAGARAVDADSRRARGLLIVSAR